LVIIDSSRYLFEIARRLGDDQMHREKENQEMFRLLFGSLCYKDQAAMELDYGIMSMVEERQQATEVSGEILAYREIILRKCFDAWLNAYRNLAREIAESLIVELTGLGCYEGNTLVYSPLFVQEEFKSRMRIEPIYLLHNELHIKDLQ
jgi:hypothetical protein